MKDGQMFHVLTYGQGNMPSFSAQLSQTDRWSVILYVRALQEPFAPTSDATPFQEAALLFRENCAACHGEDGRGTQIRKVLPLIPDFTSLAWQMSQPEMAIVNQIDYGSLPLMPSFRYKLRQEQILKLAVYVRSFAGHGRGLPVPSSSHLTKTNIYGTYCFVCHDTNGKGNPQIRTVMPELPDFTNEAWQKKRTDANLAQSILLGKGKFMLPMADKLGSVDANQMVSLVRGFSGGKQVIALERPKPPGPPAPVVVKPPTHILATPTQASPKGEQPLVAPADDSAARIRVGATIFRQYCFVCHGMDGKGTAMRPVLPPIPDFTSPAFQKEHTDVQLQTSILDGKGTLMPANRGKVTEEEAIDLAYFVRAFGPAGLVPRAAPTVTASDFEKAFEDLEKQWNELQKLLEKSGDQDQN
jgi:mono/diheme cytochrome c family protein